MIKRHNQLLDSLAYGSQATFLRLLESGMFWVWFPWATGVYEDDTKRAQEKLTEGYRP